jgi:hypothetical protein
MLLPKSCSKKLFLYQNDQSFSLSLLIPEVLWKLSSEDFDENPSRK